MGFPRASRGGKRTSSLCSVSTVSTLMLVVVCFIGAYMLSSSRSLVPGRSPMKDSLPSPQVKKFKPEESSIDTNDLANSGEESQISDAHKETSKGNDRGSSGDAPNTETNREHDRREDTEVGGEEGTEKKAEEEVGVGVGENQVDKQQEEEPKTAENLENVDENKEKLVGGGAGDELGEPKGETEVQNTRDREGNQERSDLIQSENDDSQTQDELGQRIQLKEVTEENKTSTEEDNTGGSTEGGSMGKNQEDEQDEKRENIINEAETLDETPVGANLSDPSSDIQTTESSEKESSESKTMAESYDEKEGGEDSNRRNKRGDKDENGSLSDAYKWVLCNVSAGADYIPCLDNEEAIKKIHSRKHFEHRERHCPEESPTCLVSLPPGYRQPIEWPRSRDKIWYHNVPHDKLASVKGHQNWVKVTGDYFTFPGGGTQFIHGALHYIDFLRKAVPKIAWGKQTRVVLDVGCGVASFGGYLFERNVLTMSFAPKDEHEAQVQFALERGIPAISAVMGSQRLPFPSNSFDLVHCARCRVPWHLDGGILLLELNRVLRPGGYFVWSATPVYQKLKEDVDIWRAMKSLTASLCWDLVTISKDKLNSVAAAIYRKPISNDCYKNRKKNEPLICNEDDDPNAAWYVPLQSCIHLVPSKPSERSSQWPSHWPQRLRAPPYWLNSSQDGVYGKPIPSDFVADYEHWKHFIRDSYLTELGINWSEVRNVMDMRAVYGGFAAALNDKKLWVMNVVNIDSLDTLPIIYDRGLFGIYHDWCESFSTYPRTYDLLHADQLFSSLKKRCNLVPVVAEVDRILRPGGKLIVRDDSSTIAEVENVLKSLHWEIRLTDFKNETSLLSAQKTDWRPTDLHGASK